MSHETHHAAAVPWGRRWRRTYTVVVFIILASLDNVAIGLVPPLFRPIGQSLGVPEAAVGLVTAVSYLVSALAAVGWAYVGDRANRKSLLMSGTLIWSAGTAGTAVVGGYGGFFAAQMLAALGLGAVGSVGFSVVSDLISPQRRGLVMSFWGLSQGIGTLTGGLLGGVLGASDWRRPFVVLSGIGVAATLLYLFTTTIRRGQSEPELAAVFAAGGEYEHRISRADLPHILGRRTNVWLILQGLIAQVALGSFVWLPRLLQARAEAQGYAPSTAIAIGSVYATLYQVGGALSILGGIAGDRLQRRTPRGRALVAAVGFVAAVPFYVVLFFVPITFRVPDGASGGRIVTSVLASVVTEPTVALSFIAAVVALSFMSANSPNWFALIADVNPPEHRGTAYSLVNLANGVGRSAGTGLIGLVFRLIALPPPMNYAVGLALFQAFFIPTGAMFYLASRSCPRDIAEVHDTLARRGSVTAPEAPKTQVATPARGSRSAGAG